MHEDLLPLFPLAVVLLPQNQLPLHIFEDRYKEMIALVLEEKSEFGVVLTTGDGIAATGCTAAVAEVLKKYPDGQMDILTVGQRRFIVRELNQDKEYLRGVVDYFDDSDSSAPVELRQRALSLCEQIPADAVPDAHVEDPQLSFQLAERVRDLEFRQQLLMMRSESERLRKLVEFAPVYLEKQEQITRLKDLAPKNGHGKHPPNLE